MKKISYLISILIGLALLSSCDNEKFIDDIYVTPKAAFSIDDKESFQVFESVHFKNLGTGMNFVVWPGDEGHVYGKTGNNGYACNTDGSFSYSYQEPGEYMAVWIASSIDSDGKITSSKDSVKIKVVAAMGGLTSFSITRMARMNDFGSNFFYESYGKFLDEDHIVCPMPYRLWPSYIRRTLGIKFSMSSDFAKLYWETAGGDVELISESTTKVFRFDENNQLEPQTIKVRMSSGNEDKYEIVALIIPEFSSFKINGVTGVQTRDVTAFNKFKIAVTLPSGTDLTQLVPEFVIMNNDANLLTATKTATVTVDGVNQNSGQTQVDFSSPVNYVITYSVPGSNGYTYTSECFYEVTVK